MTKQKLQPLSMYEETLIWMSYRYAIGRHTIAANSHAKDIAQNSYKRLLLSPERMQFMSKDINQSIYDCLHFGFFSIDSYTLNTTDINPLDVFYEFVDYQNIKSWEELGKFKHVEAYKENGEWKYKITLYENGEKRYVSSMDFEDLDVWQRLAKLFDKKNYVYVKTTETENTIECFEILGRVQNDEGYMKYKKFYVPVEEYVNNPYIFTYINPEKIIQ